MKKSKRIVAAVLSAVMVAALGSGSALAAESQDTPQNMASIEDERARLKRLNPHITDEEWEWFEEIESPEANGLILVNETKRVENGHLIIDSYYTDAVSPHNVGQREYRAYSKIFVDGTEYSQMIAKTYLTAVFDYDNTMFTKHVKVVDGSIKVNWVKVIDGEYPCYVTHKEYAKPQYEYNFDFHADAVYSLTLKLGLRDIQEYKTTITVNEHGEQVSKTVTFQ